MKFDKKTRPNRRTGKSMKCIKCGKSVYVPINRQKAFKYCSIKCRMLGKYRKCLHCKEMFYALPGQIKRDWGKYCSRVCVGKSQKGREMSLDWRRKIGEKLKGENSYLWRGGISCEPYTVDWTKTLKRSIRERDGYTCQICGTEQCDEAFSVHHIDYDKKNCDPKNLVTLCRRCHTKTNYKRNYWLNFFKGGDK
jgi:hypothetical protein